MFDSKCLFVYLCSLCIVTDRTIKCGSTRWQISELFKWTHTHVQRQPMCPTPKWLISLCFHETLTHFSNIPKLQDVSGSGRWGGGGSSRSHGQNYSDLILKLYVSQVWHDVLLTRLLEGETRWWSALCLGPGGLNQPTQTHLFLL